LTIKSGDTVEIQTLTTSSPTSLANAGVKSEDIEPELKAIHAEVKDKGPGGHILTGPIYIDGAEPGMCWNPHPESAIARRMQPTGSTRSGVSYLRKISSAATKLIPLDLQRNVRSSRQYRNSAAAVLRSMGVAPADSKGRINSGPPGDHAGNLDNKDLVAGTKLFIPIY